MIVSVETRLAGLATASSAELRQHWQALTASPVPRVSPRLLRLALAWEIQARANGGLSRATRQRLDQLERGSTRTSRAQPGMRLVREWDGKAHIVTIGEDQVIHWGGQTWGSLSAVARAITGTRWSGPAFFGLKTRIAA